jgi:hypothetical protein
MGVHLALRQLPPRPREGPPVAAARQRLDPPNPAQIDPDQGLSTLTLCGLWLLDHGVSPSCLDATERPTSEPLMCKTERVARRPRANVD